MVCTCPKHFVRQTQVFLIQNEIKKHFNKIVKKANVDNCRLQYNTEDRRMLHQIAGEHRRVSSFLFLPFSWKFT